MCSYCGIVCIVFVFTVGVHYLDISCEFTWIPQTQCETSICGTHVCRGYVQYTLVYDVHDYVLQVRIDSIYIR